MNTDKGSSSQYLLRSRTVKRKLPDASIPKTNKNGGNAKSTGKTKKQKQQQQQLQQQQLNPRKKQKWNSQYRSNLGQCLKMFDSITLKQQHIDVLMVTPFAHLFDAFIKKKVKDRHTKKFDDDSLAILQTFNNFGATFNIGGRQIPLKKNDVGLIFGVKSGKTKMTLTYGTRPKTAFTERRFSGLARMDAIHIRNEILECIKGEETTDYEDFGRLMCLYLCATLFFTKNGTTIGWALLKYIEDIHAMANYDWSDAIISSLIVSINKMINSPEQAHGCILLLPYWLCEHSNLIHADFDDEFPRFIKWDLSKLHNKLKQAPISAIQREEVSPGKLKLTMSERNKFIDDDGDDDDDDDEIGQEPVQNLEMTPPNLNVHSQRSSAAETIVPNTFETVGNQTPVVDNVDFHQERLSDMSMGTRNTLKKSNYSRNEQFSAEIKKLREEKKDALRINALLMHEIDNLKKENQMREDIIQELRERCSTAIQQCQKQEQQSRQAMEAKLKQIQELHMRVTDLEAEKEDHIQQIIELNVQLVTQRDMAQVCNEKTEDVSLQEMQNEQGCESAMEKDQKEEGTKGETVLEPSSKIQRIKEKTRKEKKLEEYEYQAIEKGTKKKRAAKEIKESSMKKSLDTNDFDSDDFIDLHKIQVDSKEKKKTFTFREEYPVCQLISNEEKEVVKKVFQVNRWK